MRKRAGFTLIELLVVVAIIAVLISILLPAISHARSTAKRLHCSTQLNQIGITMEYYENDNNGFFPVGFSSSMYPGWAGWPNHWYLRILKYLPIGDVGDAVNTLSGKTPYRCPAKQYHANLGMSLSADYIFNCWTMGVEMWGPPLNKPVRVISIPEPSRVLLLSDVKDVPGDCSSVVTYEPEMPDVLGIHHNLSTNILFVDGHVSSYRNPEDLYKVMIKPN